MEVLPISVRQVVEEIDFYIAENEKSARKFIKKINPRKSQGKLQIETLNKFTDEASIPSLLDPCRQGYDMAVLSEAGSPAIADPGAAVVSVAHAEKIQVIPLVGPSSILLALMGSGLNGQNFAFNGYLPIDTAERKKAIKKLENRSAELAQSQVFIETPYRNDKLLAEILRTLRPNTQLCIAADITLDSEFIMTQTASTWKENLPDLNRRPTIFIIQA